MSRVIQFSSQLNHCRLEELCILHDIVSRLGVRNHLTPCFCRSLGPGPRLTASNGRNCCRGGGGREGGEGEGKGKLRQRRGVPRHGMGVVRSCSISWEGLQFVVGQRLEPRSSSRQICLLLFLRLKQISITVISRDSSKNSRLLTGSILFWFRGFSRGGSLFWIISERWERILSSPISWRKIFKPQFPSEEWPNLTLLFLSYSVNEM